jgi:hypothetical protein
MQLLVYTTVPSPRVDYIFSTLLPAIGVEDYKLTTDKSLVRGPVINYSSESLFGSELWIKPVNLLFEKDIKDQKINCFDFNGLKAFFKTTDGDFTFDIFAASFYLIARYEEYLPYKPDMYGRYAHENSLAFKEEFLPLPLINRWLKEFTHLLLHRFPSLPLNPPHFSFLPTYDIDIAYSYLHKGTFRNLGGFVRSMWSSEWRSVAERIAVLFNRKQDPFDSYEWLDKLHENNNLKPLYFLLLAKKNKHYDKNILPKQAGLKTLVQGHSKKYDMGIHPSWQSGDKPQLLQKEMKTLENITGKKVTKSRQHYIRMNLPETYRRLIEAGITEDYSMGYGSINGFRASYTLPFFWYDLEKDERSSLKIYPFCFMDANSFYEQHYNPEQALDEMKHYYQVIKEVNGLFITIWHNHFLGTDSMFTGWKEIYKTMVEKISKDLEEKNFPSKSQNRLF